MKLTLTMLDTIGIQDYIFASNRLRDNIGASHLVQESITRWAYEAMPTPNNVDPDTGELDPDRQIDQDDLNAEAIYAGGGNTAILFASHEQARDFAERLSLRVLSEAPGLDFAVAHVPVDFENDSLATQVREEALPALATAKRERQANAPTLGLSVTAECGSTGLPATGTDPKPMPEEPARLSSAEVAAKVEAVDEANERLRSLIPQYGREFDIPRRFDDLARLHGESSYLAVVHADGNSMGERVKAIADAYSSPEQNRDYMDAMRAFSRSVEEASSEALRACVDLLWDRVEQDENGDYWLAETLPLERSTEFEGALPYLPFRPLVFGGDDVTFVCNGQVGLALAVEYLKAFERAPLSAQACAGLSVVKLHYPFARAYQLSEELCDRAKRLVREDGGSALDWHFSTTGLSGDLDEIREREYREPSGPLEMRPLRLHTDERVPDPWRSWPVFEKLISDFNRREWSEQRSKMKRLREVLRQGPDNVQRFVEDVLDQSALPSTPELPESASIRGWANGTCVHFDPIEAFDYSLLAHGEPAAKGGDPE